MLKVPNKLIFAFIKTQKKSTNNKVHNFEFLIRSPYTKKFECDVVTELLNKCARVGRIVSSFCNKGTVTWHPNARCHKCYTYISILSTSSQYYNEIEDFYSTFSPLIDLTGYTYILGPHRFVCEFISKKNQNEESIIDS